MEVEAREVREVEMEVEVDGHSCVGLAVQIRACLSQTVGLAAKRGPVVRVAARVEPSLCLGAGEFVCCRPEGGGQVGPSGRKLIFPPWAHTHRQRLVGAGGLRWAARCAWRALGAPHRANIRWQRCTRALARGQSSGEAIARIADCSVHCSSDCADCRLSRARIRQSRSRDTRATLIRLGN